MTMADYEAQILRPVITHLPSDSILVEDENKAHGLKNKNVQRLKEELGICCMADWPPTSPDLNIIETVWWLLKQRLKCRGAILGLEQLKAALREEWEILTQDEIQEIIVSTRARLEECIEKKGLATRY